MMKKLIFACLLLFAGTLQAIENPANEAAEFQTGISAYQSGDYPAAIRILVPLANLGDAKAQLHLGVMNEMGQGVPRNYKRAVARYRQAAEQGNAEAQYRLGEKYELGQGVPQDKKIAAEWYGKSASQGHAEAQARAGAGEALRLAGQAKPEEAAPLKTEAVTKPATEAPAARPAGLEAEARRGAENPLGAGDMLRITVYGNPDLTTETRVTATGTVSFPLVGEVRVEGFSVPEAERSIARLLENGGFIKQPQVNIVILQFISQQVSILGEVLKPGRYPLDRPTTLTDLLAIAGGIAANGADQIAVITRKEGKSVRLEYDLREMLLKSSSPDVWVAPGDVIYVPRARVFYIYGEVQRPGAYRLERDMMAAHALATGGGLTPRGTERGLRIKRRNASGVLEIINADANTPLQADDVVQVQESLY